MLRALKKENEITYVALDDGTHTSAAVAQAKEYADEVITVPHTPSAKFTVGFYVDLVKNSFSVLPYFMQKYRSREMREAILAQLRARKFDVVVCDFLMPAINFPDRLGTPSVLFQHNVEAQIWQRHYEVQRNPVIKAFLWRQWRKTFNYERLTCQKFDLVVAVSPEDAALMHKNYGAENLAVVPTGVDTEYFSSGKDGMARGFNIVFTGSMDWLPNDDAIRWFATSILPKIRREVPDVSLTVVGRDPSASLVDSFRHDASIRFTGRVEDVRGFMDQASVYVVPIRIGGGTRLKIYEAMSMGLPIVSTTVGAEGLSFSNGIDIVIQDDADSFAGAVIELLSDNALARKMGAAAERRARTELDWQNVARVFSNACQNLTLASSIRSNPSVGVHEAV